jgi:holin-like protein
MKLEHLFTLLACLAAGEVLRCLTGELLSASLLGMVVLTAVLAARGGPSPGFRATLAGVLGLLPLLFVPIGVGIMQQAHLIATQWLPILASLLVSTVLSLTVGGLVAQWVNRARLASRPSSFVEA